MDNLEQLAKDIVRYDPDLFGTLTEITYGTDNKHKLERILHWSNQWQNSPRKRMTEKSRPKRS